MAGEERCPGCGEKFMGGDKTQIMRWPMAEAKDKRKWHVRCLEGLHECEPIQGHIRLDRRA